MKPFSIFFAPLHSTCVLSLFFMFAPIALGHPGHSHPSGFTAGWAHPWTGLDHLLAMFAVGLWAWQIGRRAIWLIPSTFLVLMGAGFAAGMQGYELRATEPMILSSVIVIGVALFIARKWPLVLCAMLVGIFAFFHGFAHGNEMATGSNPILYASGFLLGTLLLHLLGIMAGLVFGRWFKLWALRYAGLVIALCGLVMWFE